MKLEFVLLNFMKIEQNLSFLFEMTLTLKIYDALNSLKYLHNSINIQLGACKISQTFLLHLIDRKCYKVMDGKMSCEKSKDCVEKLALIHHVLVDYCRKIVSFFELLMRKVSLILPEKPFKGFLTFFTCIR